MHLEEGDSSSVPDVSPVLLESPKKSEDDCLLDFEHPREPPVLSDSPLGKEKEIALDPLPHPQRQAEPAPPDEVNVTF